MVAPQHGSTTGRLSNVRVTGHTSSAARVNPLTRLPMGRSVALRPGFDRLFPSPPPTQKKGGGVSNGGTRGLLEAGKI